MLAGKGAKVVVNDPGGSMAGQGVDATPAEEVVREIRVAGGEADACLESVATSDIRSADKLWLLPQSSGYMDHLQRSFALAKKA